MKNKTVKVVNPETAAKTITCEKDMGAGSFNFDSLNLYKNNKLIGHYELNTNKLTLDFDEYAELTIREEVSIQYDIKKFKEEMNNGI